MVAILLSTFNGERYLQEQLDSLLAQTFQDFELIVRDDGSNDGTLEILERHRALYPFRTRILTGSRLGYGKSFLQLLSTPSRAQYFAFCDQDDVWNTEKIEVAVRALEFQPGVVCYTSSFEVVDSKLKFRAISSAPQSLDLRSALVESLIWGCTLVLNREAREEVIRDIDKAAPISHDWWTYLVITALGKIVNDPVPRMKYRQHALNLVGIHNFGIKRIFRQISGVKKRGFPRWGLQARSFYSIHKEQLSERNREIFRTIDAAPNSLRARIVLALSCSIRRRELLASYFLRIMILFGHC